MSRMLSAILIAGALLFGTSLAAYAPNAGQLVRIGTLDPSRNGQAGHTIVAGAGSG